MQLVEVAVPNGNMESPMNQKLISRSRTAGFSLVELMIVVAIAFVIAAVGIPQAMGAYRTYQLNNAATKVAGILRFTRLEAIRQNKPVTCRGQAGPGGGVLIWADEPAPGFPTGDSIPQPTETQTLLTPNADTVPAAGVPGTAAIAASLGVGALTDATVGAGGVQFDQRGAVNPVGVFYIVCIQNTVVPTAGYRAVIVMPSGATQIWSTNPAGNWIRAN